MIKSLKITTLVEDTSPKWPFWGEHGLSFWIEADDKKILFDSGESGQVLLSNFKKIKLDPNDLDAFILSHPHPDHSGGIRSIIEQIKNKPIYCTSNAYSENTDTEYGIPNGQELSQKLTDINFVTQNTEIFPSIVIPQEKNTVNFRTPTKEINLVINLEGKGLVVIVGCAHHGLLNILESAKAAFDNRMPLYAIFGGLHLKDSTEQEIVETINAFKKHGLKYLFPNHCTGFKALSILSKDFPKEMQFLADSPSGSFHTGKSITL